ncbi:hypothetical protein A2U01_0033434, partial [Trifolium medium]|nr:hypothetical protein [Trifolium medium]
RQFVFVLVDVFSSIVTAAVLWFISGWSRNLEVASTKTTRLYGEVVTNIRTISTLSSEKEMVDVIFSPPILKLHCNPAVGRDKFVKMHMGYFSLHSMVPLHLIFSMLVD